MHFDSLIILYAYSAFIQIFEQLTVGTYVLKGVIKLLAEFRNIDYHENGHVQCIMYGLLWAPLRIYLKYCPKISRYLVNTMRKQLVCDCNVHSAQKKIDSAN